MTDPTLMKFFQAGTAERLQLVKDPAAADAVRGYLGAAAFAEYAKLAEKLDRSHLGIDTPPNVVFVPGVMGSLLMSRKKGGVWWIDVRERNHIDDLRLAPYGTEDADRANAIEPFTCDQQYEPFLTAVLETSDFNHEVFPYDWRKLTTAGTAALRDLVARLHSENGGNPVHLVGHSMGGLMIRAALLTHGDEMWPKVGRVLFIGTPHYGSQAIGGYLKNHLWGFNLMALLGVFLSRATFRSLWGPLAMLPAPVKTYPGTRDNDPAPWHEPTPSAYAHPCANFDLYDAASWHLDLNGDESAQLQTVLNGAADFHRFLYDGHMALSQDYRDRMAVIAGVGYQTLFRLEETAGFLGLWEHMRKITDRIEGDRHREGDGRVPLASAELENVQVRYVSGKHGGLPNIPAVYEAAFAYLRGEDMGLARTPTEALSQHLGVDDTTSEAPHLDGTAGGTGDDPGVLQLDPPAPDEIQRLERQLDEDQLPEFTGVRLL